MKKFLAIILLLLASCSSPADSNSIIGKWSGNNPDDGTMIFHKNGKFEVFDKNSQSPFEAERQTFYCA